MRLDPDLYALADIIEAAVRAGRADDTAAQDQLIEWSGREQLRLSKRDAANLQYLPHNLRRAAKRLREMADISRQIAGGAEPLPTKYQELVQYDQISVVALAGYPADLQATLYTLVAQTLFSARVTGELNLRVLLVLEEAHNFAPARAERPAEKRAAAITRQIAQEGRKFGLGLLLISQRPSRLDETALSQCNSHIIMRLVNPDDQRFVRQVVETLGEEDARLLPDLDVGEALLSGQLINFPVLVRIKQPASRGEHEEEQDAFTELETMHRQAQQQEPPNPPALARR
jgi:hypothetical protein